MFFSPSKAVYEGREIMTGVSQLLVAINTQPLEAHIYNAAAELLRDNPAAPDIELSRKQHRHLAGGGLQRLLFRLGQEFGREHASTLVVSVHVEQSILESPRYFVRFQRRPAP